MGESRARGSQEGKSYADRERQGQGDPNAPSDEVASLYRLLEVECRDEERSLAGQTYFCFLDGYSGYNQTAIHPDDQEKTTFICPFGPFVFR